MFDSNRLRGELAHVHRMLGNVTATAGGKVLLDELRRTMRGTNAARLWQALYADCMRIAYAAVAADGEIGDDEIEALYDMLSTAARSYADTVPASYARFIAVDRTGARAFLETYAIDDGPSGRRAPVPWPGLALCRRAAEIGDGAALVQYERTMTWLIGEVCRIGGVGDGDPRWRGRIDELDELRRSLARDAVVEAPGVDLRVRAFLSPAWVFTAVQQASSIFENDPFDIESIHRAARDSFEQLLELARAPTHILASGRMLLVLGDSGGGKTHLLRGFRHQVQEYGRGFVVYAQLQSSSSDYERYLLQHLIDSLMRPYSAASGERTGLRELAHGLVRLASASFQPRVQRLIDGGWEGNAGRAQYVNELVDELLQDGTLATFDKDLLRVMLYALCPDPRVTSSVYRYLRCEPMNDHDRKWIGDVTPRTEADHPHLMFRGIGRLAAMTQRALVVMIDQVDLTGFEQTSCAMFKRAIDALYKITSEVPSAVAVIACLKDLYQTVRGDLNQPALDRLEKSPPIAWLESNRSYAEIEEVVSRRLAWLFDTHGAVHRPEEPVYPIPEVQLQLLDNRRMRDVLEWCHEFQTRCATAGRILDDDDSGRVPDAPKPQREDLDQIAAAWNDAMQAEGVNVPTDDDKVLDLLAATAQAFAEEAGVSASPPIFNKETLRVSLSTRTGTADLVIAVTNKNYHRGAFPGQLDKLCKRARNANAIAIAVRTLEFPRGEACDRAIAQLVKDGGRRAVVDVSTLRALAVFQRFRPEAPADRVLAWRRRDRPISSLPVIAAMFNLEPARAMPPIEPAATTAAPEAMEPVPAGASRVRSVARPPSTRVRSARIQPAIETSHGDATMDGKPTAPATTAPSLPSAASRSVDVEPVATPPVATASKTIREPRSVTLPPLPKLPTTPMPAVAQRVAAAPQVGGAAVVSPVVPVVTRRGPIAAAGSAAGERAAGTTPRASAPELAAAGSAAATAARGAGPTSDVPAGGSAAVASPVASGPQVRPSKVQGTRPPLNEPSSLWIGNSPGFQPEPRMLELGALLQHVAIAGDERAANTRLVLNVIEQALERDVAVIAVDRQGDLAGYARPDWWQRSSDPERARRLAERLDVRLFTPGSAAGRSLALPVVPDLAHVPDHERDRAVQRAASGLAAIMRVGDGAVDAARLAVLSHAIAVLAGRGTASSLADLVALIEKQDDALVARAARAGRYDDALFKRVVQELQSTQLSDAGLFDPMAETLSMDALVGRRAPETMPLAIVSTRFLGDEPRTQAWIAQLIGCLTRQPAQERADELKTVLVIDDAELVLPASGKSPTKEPLQELLKRSRNTGLGVVLRSQRAAELDVRSRPQAATWFLGRMPDARTNDKLNPLFDHLPPIRNKLAGLERDRFVMLQDRAALDLECAPSLWKGEPVSDGELNALAAETRSPRPALDAAIGALHDEIGRADAGGSSSVPATWAQ